MKYYLLIVFMLFFSMVVKANDNPSPDFVSLSFENDVFFKDDGLYSNGLFFAWGYNHINEINAQHLPMWIAYLANKTHLTSSENKQFTVSYSVGQVLQTAIDISVEELVEEDAPYVGLLAWEVNLLAYGEFVSDEVG